MAVASAGCGPDRVREGVPRAELRPSPRSRSRAGARSEIWSRYTFPNPVAYCYRKSGPSQKKPFGGVREAWRGARGAVQRGGYAGMRDGRHRWIRACRDVLFRRSSMRRSICHSFHMFLCCSSMRRSICQSFGLHKNKMLDSRFPVKTFR